MKRKTRERIGLTALNIFFIVLCIVTLIPILYALSVSFSGTNSLLSSDFPSYRRTSRSITTSRSLPARTS